jgi:hypothetical protein
LAGEREGQLCSEEKLVSRTVRDEGKICRKRKNVLARKRRAATVLCLAAANRARCSRLAIFCLVFGGSLGARAAARAIQRGALAADADGAEAEDDVAAGRGPPEAQHRSEAGEE